jgi:hypothetical protein
MNILFSVANDCNGDTAPSLIYSYFSSSLSALKLNLELGDGFIGGVLGTLSDTII